VHHRAAVRPARAAARDLTARRVLRALHGGFPEAVVIVASGSLPVARRAPRVVIVLSCLGVAAAAWLVPASVEIVAWPATGPARVALFGSMTSLWLSLATGL